MTKEERQKATDKACSKAYYDSPEGRAWRASAEGIASRKAADLKVRCKKVGIAVEYYHSLPKKCSIKRCATVVPGGSGDWHLDHNKVTQKFRGLLCFKHNHQVSDLTLEDVEDVKEYLLQHSINNSLILRS